jgi:hypothetical protein
VTLPYVVEHVGALPDASAAATAVARRMGLDPPTLLHAGMNATFRCGDVVLRVGRPTAPASCLVELHARLAVHGLRVPEIVAAPISCSELVVWPMRHVPTVGVADWTAVGQMVAALHSIPVSALADAYPVATVGDLPLWRFDELLAGVDDLLDDAARAGLRRVIDRWPVGDGGGLVLCHGDIHPGNVLSSAAGPVLIDWDLVCAAPQAWDHAPMMRWEQRWGGQAGAYHAFAAGYGASLCDDPVAESLAELRLAAATLMRLAASRHSTAAADQATLRLRYWRGEVDAPAWTPS